MPASVKRRNGVGRSPPRRCAYAPAPVAEGRIIPASGSTTEEIAAASQLGAR